MEVIFLMVGNLKTEAQAKILNRTIIVEKSLRSNKTFAFYSAQIHKKYRDRKTYSFTNISVEFSHEISNAVVASKAGLSIPSSSETSNSNNGISRIRLV